MKIVIALVVVSVLLAAAVSAGQRNSRRYGGPKAHQLTADYSYEQYLHDFHKSYKNPLEHARRAKNFAKALKDVLAHNAKPHVSYKKGINHLSDWDDMELQGIRGGRFDPKMKMPSATSYTPSLKKVAASLDWRQHFPPVVTAVKDQGQCGDCWAHAVTEAIESSFAIATGQLFVLSQQQVTSCTPSLGSCFACGGSFPSLGYEYATSNGITEEWIYPFESYTGTSINCSATPYISTPINTIVNISGYTNVGANNQEDFVAALNELGPMSILVDASSWSSYESGIFNGCDYADNISMDHAVQVVGYGTEKGQDYWIVRNSWAPSWGERGFIRLAKPSTVQCGWNTGAAYPSDCTGTGPAATWACGTCGILFGAQFPTASPSGSSSSGSHHSSSSAHHSSSSAHHSSSSAHHSSSSAHHSSSGSAGASFVVYGIGQQFPTPPTGYVQASFADVTSSAFVSLYNSAHFTDLNQEMAGCCVFNLTDGFLQYQGQFVVPYATGGARQCLEQLSNPVYFGTDGGSWVQTLDPSTLSVSTDITPFCGTQPNTFGIFKQA